MSDVLQRIVNLKVLGDEALDVLRVLNVVYACKGKVPRWMLEEGEPLRFTCEGIVGSPSSGDAPAL